MGPVPNVALATVVDHTRSDFLADRVKAFHSLQALPKKPAEVVSRDRDLPMRDLVTGFRYMQHWIVDPVHTGSASQALTQHRHCTGPERPELPEDIHSHTREAPLLVVDFPFRSP
jgi:hypothetical protein